MITGYKYAWEVAIDKERPAYRREAGNHIIRRVYFVVDLCMTPPPPPPPPPPFAASKKLSAFSENVSHSGDYCITRLLARKRTQYSWTVKRVHHFTACERWCIKAQLLWLMHQWRYEKATRLCILCPRIQKRRKGSDSPTTGNRYAIIALSTLVWLDYLARCFLIMHRTSSPFGWQNLYCCVIFQY